MALELGTTVAELEYSLSAAELSEWMEFYNLEPWGSEVAFWRAGMIASVLANINRDSKKKRDPFVPEDFMPIQRAKRKTLDPREVRAKFLTAFGPGKKNGRKDNLRASRSERTGSDVEGHGAEGSQPVGSEGSPSSGEADSSGSKAVSPETDRSAEKIDHRSKRKEQS